MNAIHDHPRRHSITATEYLRMGTARVFAHDARLELMEGEIVEMAPIGSAHAGAGGAQCAWRSLSIADQWPLLEKQS